MRVLLRLWKSMPRVRDMCVYVVVGGIKSVEFRNRKFIFFQANILQRTELRSYIHCHPNMILSYLCKVEMSP